MFINAMSGLQSLAINVSGGIATTFMIQLKIIISLNKKKMQKCFFFNIKILSFALF